MQSDHDSRTSGAAAARERLADLGEIAAEIAHELRNVLQVLASNAFVARTLVSRGDARGAEPHVVTIERHARAAQEVVDDLLALARGDALVRERVPVGDAMSLGRQGLEASARWTDLVTPDDLAAYASPRLFARMLRVLYENAIQACAPRRALITTRARAKADGAGIVVEVSDDGPGVPDDIAPRVFEPLVTARPGGSGLGLALARRIAGAHGGSLALEPAALGATFRLELGSR